MDVGVSPCGQRAAGARACSADEERRARDLLVRFLAGFGLIPGPHLEQLTRRLVARAAAGRENDAMELGRLALAAAEAELDAWFALVLGKAVGEGGGVLLIGRAAWRACGAAERWPDALLAREVPQALAATLRAAVPPAVPPEQPGAMLEQPFEAWALHDLVPKPGIARLLPRRSAAA